MWRSLRKLFLISMLIVLLLPLRTSSAFWPLAAISVVGAVWTGINVFGVGASSAAVARADERWVSDPAGVTPVDFDNSILEWTTTRWNIGRASSVSIAPASAQSGNAITIRAETSWEQPAFSFSYSINRTHANFPNKDGVIFGKGFAHGTFEGIVTREWLEEDRKQPAVARVPIGLTLSNISLPFESNLDGAWLNIKLRAWKKDDIDTESERPNWNQQFDLASASLNGHGIEYLQVDGNLEKVNL